MRQESSVNRREVLKTGGVLGAVGLSGVSAGCLSLLPPTGQQVRYGRVDVPDPTSDDPVYRKWMPADSELPDAEHVESVSEMHWQFATPGDLGLAEVGGEFSIATAVIKSASDYVGYTFDSYDYALGLGSLGTVAEGEFDTDIVAETMAKTDYEAAGTYHDYTFYDRTDTDRLVAVSGSAIVHTNGESRRQKAETLVDAGDGRIDRYHETDEQFAAFTDWVGTYPSILEAFWLPDDEPEPELAAMTYTFDQRAVYFLHHAQYVEGDTPGRGTLEQHIDEGLDRARQAYSVDIEIEKPRVRIEIRMDESALSETTAEDREPLVTWGVDHGEETVAIEHEAGDPIPVDKLEFEPVNAVVEPPPDGTRLEPGDTLTFDISQLGSKDRIRVTFHPTENSYSTIFGYDVDENGPDSRTTPEESDTDT